MNLKEIATLAMIQTLEQAGFIYKPSFVEGVIVNYNGVVTIDSVIDDIKSWKQDMTREYQAYKKLTDPFTALSPYETFSGFSATFSKHSLKEKSNEIQSRAKEHLMPFLEYPYHSTAAIHYFSTGVGNTSYCLCRDLEAICEYWTKYVEELYSRLSATDALKYSLNSNTIYFSQNDCKRVEVAGKWEFKWNSGHTLRVGEHYTDTYVDTIIQVMGMFPEQVEVIDNRTTKLYNNSMYGSTKINIEPVTAGDTFDIVTKNGLDDYRGKLIYHAKSIAGGWFMRPKGGFDGVANPDTYTISTNPKFRVTFYN